eukprot:5183783-Ditylum_brightwellii.AAC.1
MVTIGKIQLGIACITPELNAKGWDDITIFYKTNANVLVMSGIRFNIRLKCIREIDYKNSHAFSSTNAKDEFE